MRNGQRGVIFALTALITIFFLDSKRIYRKACQLFGVQNGA